MPLRQHDRGIVESEDGAAGQRDRSRSPVRPDGGHGPHLGSRRALQLVGDRRRLSGPRGRLRFPKSGALDEGGLDGTGGGFQFLSGEKSGSLRRGRRGDHQ